jgi:hypothetical protein
MFITTACGTETNNNKGEENTNSNTNTETSESEKTVYDDIELYSDDTKYVFEMGNTKYIFYYSGDEITGYTTYTEYEDAETANAVYSLLKKEDLTGVDKYYTKGKYIVYELNKSEYEDMKASDIKLAYSYMKEVKKEQ